MARILLLDDDEDLLYALADLVRAIAPGELLLLRSVAELEAHGAEALACDLAILDINLGPHQPSGLDAHAWLTANGFGGRVIFLTGHAAAHPLVGAAGRSGSRVLRKPFALDDLRKLLAT